MRRWSFLSREANIIALVGLLAVAIGWLTQSAVELALLRGRIYWPALAPVAIPCVLLVAVRPVFGAVAALGFAFVDPSSLRPLMELGPFSVRYFDVVFGLMTCSVLARMVLRRDIAISTEFWKLFAPLLPFLLYVGISLAIVPFSAPDSFGLSVSSYMRLVVTASFAPVLHLALRDQWDMRFFHKAFMAFAVVTIIVGTFLALAGIGHDETKTFAGRFGGELGIISFGLVSGLLVLYAFIKRDEKARPIQWKISFVLGSLGLFLAKTASSIFAAAGAVTVYFAAIRSGRRGVTGVLRLARIGTITTIAAALAVWIFRPSDTSGFLDLSGGSFAHRLMISYVGLEIFLDNPLVGVGWQASTAEAVMVSPRINAAVMEEFPRLPTHYFTKPATLHSMYIQFLAELGLIGVVLFAWTCFRIGKSVARIVNNIPVGSPYKVWAQFCALGLIFLLIWWNNNPLYGGQTESMLAMTLLAVLANVAELEKKRREHREAPQY